ncbi:MAG: hypothetical protein IH623_15020 [Verrucomicrobia bacterium]|nr:hypothetical protein [Verrucomicrobiota bacterium]
MENWVAGARGDEQMVEITMRLRKETAVTAKWIAERLGMDAAGYVNHLIAGES